MKQVALEAKKRTECGKNYNKKVRAQGNVPAVIYGKDFDPVKIEIPDKEFRQGMSKHGANAVFSLNVEGSPLSVMAQEIQRHPVTKALFHIDFHKVDLDKKVSAVVAVHLEGEAKGVKAGGTMSQLLWNVDVEALPLNLPDRITLDVSGLDVGEEIRVKDLKAPEGVEITADPEEVVVAIQAQKEEAGDSELSALLSDTPDQPEVIKKGKEE